MGDGLTDEQRERIERNRLAALEKLKLRQNEREIQLRLQEQQLKQKEVLPITEKKQIQPPEASSAVVKKVPPIKISVQLYSETEFFTTDCPPLHTIYSSIAGYKFSVKDKSWIFPLTQYSTFCEKLGENKPNSSDAIPKSVLTLFQRVNARHKSIDWSLVDDKLVQSLYPFQKEGVEAVINRGGRIILADDMGLGKSIQAIGIASYYRLEWPLLIVTPASMVASWHEQILRWLSASLNASDVCVVYDGKSSLDGLVNIISYDLAVRVLPTYQGIFRVIIADECHALKSSDSKRSKTLLPFLQASTRTILLSGTPALSRPMELYPQIQAVQPKLFPKVFDFGRRYCGGQLNHFGWDFKGSSNLRELQLVLERTVMIRRTKDAVMSQLPRKIRHQVDKKELETFKKLSELRHNMDSVGDESLEEFTKNAQYMALWKRTAEIKLPSILQYMDDLLEADHKMLIFAHHQSILDAIEGHLLVRKTRFMRIDGKTPPSGRQDLCNMFQQEASMRVAILSITAASTGLTLTAATTVIFAELFWNPGVMVQAEDRAHRIGQVDSVNVHYLLAKGTTDDSIWPMILKKLSMLESVGLGKNDFNSIRKEEHDPSQQRITKFFKRPLVDDED